MSERGSARPVSARQPDEASSGWIELFSGKNAIYSIAFGGSVALHALNIYIATTIMPSVVGDIGGLDFYAWSTTLFVVASILAAALSTKLLQQTGARGAYVVAAVLFSAGTLASALALNMPALLLGRFVQGIGGGFLYALAYGVIRLVFPERLWSRAIGLISVMWGVATLVGPAIGGIFAEIGAWRAAFWSLIPFAALFGAMAFAVLPKHRAGAGKSSPMPVWQLLLLTAAVLVLSAGSIREEVLWNIVSIAGAVGLGGLLIATESKSRARLLPKGALRMTSPLGALYATIALLMIGMQPEIFVPYLLQLLHGQSPLFAGYLAALMAMGWTLGSMTSASWSGDSARRVIVAGPILGLGGLGLLVVFLPIEAGGDWRILAPICVGLVLVGLGIGLTWPHLVTRVYQTASEQERDRAAGAITTVQLSATALGAASAGMVANLAGLTQPGGVAGASNAALWLSATFALAPALCVITALRATRQSLRHAG